MGGFSYKVEGLDKLKKVFGKLPPDLQKNIKSALVINAGLIRDAAKRDAPKDENRLGQSITVVQGRSVNVDIVAQNEYAAYVEFGTKSSAVIPAGLESVASQFRGPGRKGDPLKALQGWVKRKGLAATFSVNTRKRTRRTKNEAQLEKQLTYIIWRKIKKFGINPQPYFFKQLPKQEAQIKRDVSDAIERSLNGR